MKRFLTISIMVLIVVLACTLNVYAANANVKLVPSTTNVKAGDTVTVAINVECNESFEGLTGTLTYDKTKLELTNVQNGKDVNNMNGEDAEGNYVVTVFLNGATTIKTGTVQTLTFKVLDKVNADDKLVVKLNADMKDGETKVEGLNVQTTLTVKGQEGNNPTTPPAEDGNKDLEPTPQQPSTDNNNNNNNKAEESKVKNDNTTSKTTIPYTGMNSIVTTIIIALVVISLVSYISYIKYKNI